MRTVAFDLVAATGTQPLAVTVPRAQFFFIALKGRVPGAPYRVTYDWIIDPDTPSRPPAAGLHGEYEMNKIDYRPFPVSSFPPACGEIERRFGDLMRVRDEREVQEKLLALGDANEGGDCPVLKLRRKEGHDLAEPKLRNSHSLYSGDELRYVVERFDPATGAALKTWRFTVRAEPVRLGWAYENEEAWIVGETSRDIVEMVLYARDRSLPSAEQLAFSVAAEAAPGTFPRYVVAFTPGPGSPQRVWARFFQRNLMSAAAASAGFRRSVLGLAKDAQRASTVNETFTGLELWPVNSLQEATPLRGSVSGRPPTGEREDLRREECARGVAVVQNAPERVPVYFWMTLDGICHEARQDQSLPEARRWLRTLTPWGTALMPRQRMVVLMDRTLDGPQLWAALHELAPFEPTALWALALDPRMGTFEQVTTLYGPLAEYDLAVMKRLAWTRRADVATYRRLFEKVTAIAPLEYLTLGNYLLDFELDDEAAAAFEKAIAQASDRIAVSNSVQWLVGYYCDHARIDRAREVAQMAADVYSARGLQSMGYFSERMGRYADAESWYQKIVERYGEGSGRTALEDFYIRYARRVGDDRFSGQAAAALATVFPAGLERVSVGDLGSPPLPRQSVNVQYDSQGGRGIGLIKDDLVLAVNGYRVHDSRQYHLVLTFDDRPALTMIVWRQGRAVELKGHLKRSAYGPIARSS